LHSALDISTLRLYILVTCCGIWAGVVTAPAGVPMLGWSLGLPQEWCALYTVSDSAASASFKASDVTSQTSVWSSQSVVVIASG